MTKRFILLFALQASFLSADMTYDPIHNLLYSTPWSSDVSQAEYFNLLQWREQYRTQIKNNIKFVGGDASRCCDKQIFHYLRQIASPAALRLIEDLKKGFILYPDGSLCCSNAYSTKFLDKIQYLSSASLPSHALLASPLVTKHATAQF